MLETLAYSEVARVEEARAAATASSYCDNVNAIHQTLLLSA